jgi:hypothetical protein
VGVADHQVEYIKLGINRPKVGKTFKGEQKAVIAALEALAEDVPVSHLTGQQSRERGGGAVNTRGAYMAAPHSIIRLVSKRRQ